MLSIPEENINFKGPAAHTVDAPGTISPMLQLRTPWVGGVAEAALACTGRAPRPPLAASVHRRRYLRQGSRLASTLLRPRLLKYVIIGTVLSSWGALQFLNHSITFAVSNPGLFPPKVLSQMLMS